MAAVALALAGCDRYDRGFGGSGVVPIDLSVAAGARAGDTLAVFGMDGEGRRTVARFDVEGREVGERVRLPIGWPAVASMATAPGDGWVLATTEGREDTFTVSRSTGETTVHDGEIHPAAIAVGPDGTVVVPNSRSMHVAFVPPAGPARIVETRIGDFGAFGAAAVQADGSAIVAGSTVTARGGGPRDLVLLRYRPDHTLDTAWAWHGASLLDLGGDEIAQAATVDPQGRLLVTALSSRENQTRQWVLRFTPDGRLDPAWDGDGLASAGQAFHGEGRTIHVRPDGRVVTAGVAILGDFDLLTTQWLPDGRLDDAWGERGTNRTDRGSYEYVVASALLGDGRLLVGGWADGNVLARYHKP